jgi:hypothetical protein
MKSIINEIYDDIDLFGLEVVTDQKDFYNQKVINTDIEIQTLIEAIEKETDNPKIIEILENLKKIVY